MEKTVEICCGSYADAVSAVIGGAKRIELNSALFMGGLTPSLASLCLVKQNLDCEVIAMVRPRGAGFCYEQKDIEVMLTDSALLMEKGADGIAFGFLNEDNSIDIANSKVMIELIHSFGRQAVFHRAFDCCSDPYQAIQQLIELGADRILTSGGQANAILGKELIKSLQMRYGTQIEILAGSGINEANAKELMEYCGIHQIHSSCKSWQLDSTTQTDFVSYAYGTGDFSSCYDVVDEKKVKALIESIQ